MTRPLVALLIATILASMIPIPITNAVAPATATLPSSTATNENATAPVIVPLWKGAPATTVAFSPDEKYVFVISNNAYGHAHGDYILVVSPHTDTYTPYLYVYETLTGKLVAKATGVGFYYFDEKSGKLTKLWTSDILAKAFRGYVFSDKIVVVTDDGWLYVFDYRGNVIWDVKLPIDYVDSGFAVTEDGVYVAVGPGGSATFPAPVVLVNLVTHTVKGIATATSRVLRLAIDEEREFVVIGEENGNLRIVSFSGGLLWNITRPKGISSIAYNSHNHLLAVGDRGGWLALYEVDDPTNPTLITNITDPDAGYEHGVYAPTSLSNSGLGGMDRQGRIIVYHNPFNGYTWILYVPTRTWYKYTGGEVHVICYAIPAAVSPSGTYIYAGRTLFLVAYQDVQAHHPRVRFWGTMKIEREYQSLSSPIIVSAPSRDWHLYFYGGRITIKRVYVEPVPVSLVTDPDVVEGKLSKMLSKGLVSAKSFYTENAEVKNLDIVPGTEVADILREYGVRNPENFVATLALTRFIPPPYFSEGSAWIGTVIHIPLNKPINVYDDMVMQLSTSIHTTSLAYDKNKRALAILGVPVDIGGGIGVSAATYSKIANRILIWYASRYGVRLSTAYAVATSQTVAKLAGIVGIAVAIWGGIDAALVKWGGLGDVNVQDWIVIAPTVVDRAGDKYTAIQLILPLEESKNVQKYYDILSKYFNELGYKDVGFRVTYPCRTWKEYKKLLATGYSPQVKLDDLIEETIAAKHGLSLDELKIVGVDVIIITAIRAKETFWEWLFGLGGVYFDSVTLVGTAYIQVKARLKAGTITDPNQIASLLGTVSVNGKSYELVPGPKGAYAEFGFPLGANKLAIRFPSGKTGYYADIEITARVLIKKDFQPLGDFGYTTRLHYDWNNTLIRIDRIEFVDMPYPMLKAERIFIYRYGNFTNDITSAFELKQVLPDPTSPTGERYYYATIKNTKFIDPANGGTMMPCKTYVFNYFYREPPDAGIAVYLNGTRVTSTLAHHATVVINSSTSQDVTYALTIRVEYLEGLKPVVLEEKRFEETVHVPTNGTVYRIYNIAPFVDAAISFMKSQNKTAFLVITARVVKARYDYYKDNDEFRVVYYPPSLLPTPLPPGNFTVTIRVLQYVAENHSWVPAPNATVRAFYGVSPSNSRLTYTATTNAKGVAILVLPSGIWTFEAVKEGYLPARLTAPIYNDTVIQLYLAPVPQPPPEERTYVKENVTVVLNVYDATNGAPIPNATVTLVYVAPNSSSYYNKTFVATTDAQGKARMEVPIGLYNVTVNATGYAPFRSRYLFDKDTVVNIALVPLTINASEFARLEVRVFYADGKPYEGAHVEVRNASNGALVAALATNSFGNATLLLPKYQTYNVTVKIREPLYNRSYVASKLVTLSSDTVVTFTVPWNSTQPPTYINGTPYYWLAVQVVWANGLPFHGARVEVFNYSSGALIDELVTNGTGTVYFLLPAFQTYLVWVNATNPYNGTNYQATFVLNLTDNRWITVELPWLPLQPELAKRYRVVVYAYDVLNGKGIEGVTVVLRKGDVAWTAETNSTGYATLWVPFLGLYNVTGIHPDYEAVWRTVQIYENNTLINLPMSPAPLNFSEVPPPPLNGSEYPPIYINGTPYYWLSIQVLYEDGYPFHGAKVTVIDLATNETIATGVTNGTGFVHFLIKANTTIKYTVDAYNPELNETYHAERVVNMTQHYYFVHVVPWTSRYFSPEVWLMNATFVIHRGQGYFFGNMSHLVLLTIWTNKAQNVTVLLAVYNVDEGRFVENETVELSLHRGYGTYFTWVSINASRGGHYRVFVNITKWEYDTDPSNNYLWTNTVFLKPFVDIRVFALWRPVRQKQPWTLLPGDIIEVCIGVSLPINTSSIPAKLTWRVEELDLEKMRLEVVRGSEEELRVVKPGIVWRNVTIVVPWTSRIVIVANVTHPWEDLESNNAINITIPVDPDTAIEVARKPIAVVEGQPIDIVVVIRSNVEPGKGVAWVSIEDNTTKRLLLFKQVTLKPRLELEYTVTAPLNPTAFWVVRAPSYEHIITTRVTGYDAYPEDNVASFEVTVISYQWLAVVAAIAILIALLAAIRALTHVIHDATTRRFVRKPRFLRKRLP